ncbi:hypothetical protein ACPV5G_21060, partial [Photobacterium damselae]|uniref:hypothetical protein n=1 Tax=Photobacterium damselae TaxID=38293 RepID=UPI004068591B
RREYQKQYNDLINTDNAKAFVTDYKNSTQTDMQQPANADEISQQGNIDVSATVNAGPVNKEKSAEAQPRSQQKAFSHNDFGLTDEEAKLLREFTINDDGALALDGSKLSSEDKAQYLKKLAQRYKQNKGLFDLLKSDKAKNYLQYLKESSEAQHEKAKEQGPLPPKPSDYGLTDEEAEMLTDPDPALMDMKLAKGETSTAERLKQQQEADRYKKKFKALLNSERGKAFLNAEGGH